MRQYDQLARSTWKPSVFTLNGPAAPERDAICAIPLIEAPIFQAVEKMPVERVPGNIDRMPMAKLPAPPCPEAKR